MSYEVGVVDVTTNSSYDVEKPLSLGCSIPYSIGCQRFSKLNIRMLEENKLPEHPVLIMPPIVAPGAGSI